MTWFRAPRGNDTAPSGSGRCREGGKQMTGGTRAIAELLLVLGANKGAGP